jgi:hypothetical protein
MDKAGAQPRQACAASAVTPAGLQQWYRTGEPLSCTGPTATKSTPSGGGPGDALAHQDLPSVGAGGDPGGQVHRATEVVAALGDHRPGRHPDVRRRQAGRWELLHHAQRVHPLLARRLIPGLQVGLGTHGFRYGRQCGTPVRARNAARAD